VVWTAWLETEPALRSSCASSYSVYGLFQIRASVQHRRQGRRGHAARREARLQPAVEASNAHRLGHQGESRTDICFGHFLSLHNDWMFRQHSAKPFRISGHFAKPAFFRQKQPFVEKSAPNPDLDLWAEEPKHVCFCSCRKVLQMWVR
jgi:hypothetical protein